ncbi:MAG TPA: polyprenyl synthetase [Bacteroidetes bacterium]|jgi:octaprenyl-diphosphate synthase|nr:polyprenyl synthetase [Bacteroidota bacterium]
MDFDKIVEPIHDELEKFEIFYKSQLDSEIPILNTVLNYMTKSSGKRLRSVLVLLTSYLFGEITERSFIGASMIEILHNATLIHDDVVDEASERRGLLSVNAVWRNKVAVLVGDYLLAKGLMISLNNNEFDFLHVITNAVKTISEGELLSIEASRKLDLSEEKYYEIIRKKTAVLLKASCEIGAIATNQSPEIISQIGEYGEKVGMAFQIRDDIFDYTQTSKIIGKPVGNDLKERKITLPLIYALNNSTNSEVKHILHLIKNKNISSKDIAYIIGFVKDKDGIAQAQAKAESFSESAIETLDAIKGFEAKNLLKEISFYVINRTK